MRDLAGRLIAHQASERKSSGTESPTISPVSETLRAPLAALVGNTGFSALLSRALVLAGKEVAWLRAVHIDPNGSMNAPAGLLAKVDPGQFAEGRVVLLANLLELLTAFIGENLTMQLMGEVFPELFLSELNLGTGG